MDRNVEIKARIDDFEKRRRIAAGLSDTPEREIRQEDTFFVTPQGRLKLRVFSPTEGELIYYERSDQPGPKPSHYTIFHTQEPETLKSILTAALGLRGVVRKTRLLYLVGQTRIHLDRVENLGDFLELEVVVRPEQSLEEAARIAADLMRALEIRNEDLLNGAYIDLLEKGIG